MTNVPGPGGGGRVDRAAEPSPDEADPAWAHEAIHLVDYHLDWPRLAAAFGREVADAVGVEADQVQHIGSTAVPGLAAKPVIDLQVAVDDLDGTTTRVVDALNEAGWVFVPPGLDPMPWRRFFVRPSADQQHRLAHLHLIERGDPELDLQVKFREALRADDTVRDRYADLKHQLARQHAEHRGRYTDAKSAFVTAVLAGETPPP